MSEIRLQRFLAQGGVAARRKAELLIVDGRVAVNGKVVTVLGTKVNPSSDRVTVDGNLVQPEDTVYVVFNKPKACITAKSDPHSRRTVMEFLPGLPASVTPVGRLDFYTEGVLLLTNDGALAAALLAADSGVEKTYHVKLKGNIDDKEIEKLRSGVEFGPGQISAEAQVDRLKAKSRHDWLVITIHEGKNRQIHRMLEAVGHVVTKLQRVAFAGVGFHGLRVGDARELSQNEVKELYSLSGIARPKGVISRGKWSVKREATDQYRRSADRARPQRTPSLTPGGSRKAKAKLLARYEEDAAAGINLGPERLEQVGKGPARSTRPAPARSTRPAPARSTSTANRNKRSDRRDPRPEAAGGGRSGIRGRNSKGAGAGRGARSSRSPGADRGRKRAGPSGQTKKRRR